jgi:hypothetical protein
VTTASRHPPGAMFCSLTPVSMRNRSSCSSVHPCAVFGQVRKGAATPYPRLSSLARRSKPGRPYRLCDVHSRAQYHRRARDGRAKTKQQDRHVQQLYRSTCVRFSARLRHPSRQHEVSIAGRLPSDGSSTRSNRLHRSETRCRRT